MAQQATGGSALGSALVASATAGAKQLLYDQAAQLLRDKGVPRPERLIEAVSLMAAGRSDVATTVLAGYISDEFVDPSRRQTLLVVMEQLELWSKPLLGEGNEVAQVASAARRILAEAPTMVASTSLLTPAAPTWPTADARPVYANSGSSNSNTTLAFDAHVTDTQSFSGKGRALFDAGQYQAALSAFTLAAVSDPGPLRLFDLAKTYGALGDFQAAAFLYRRFLSETDLTAAREAARLLLVQCDRRTSTTAPVGVALAPARSAVQPQSPPSAPNVVPMAAVPILAQAAVAPVAVPMSPPLGTPGPVSAATTAQAPTVQAPTAQAPTVEAAAAAPPQAQSADATITDDRPRTATIMVWVTPTDSTVTVAGERVTVERAGSLIRVAPGRVAVRAEHPSCTAAALEIKVAAYERKQVMLKLEGCGP